MKTKTRDIALFALILFVCSLARGQELGFRSLTGSQCSTFDVSSKATVTYQVLGTWTGTIQPKVSVAGQTAVNGQATPVASTTAASTVTVNGAYFSSVAGYSFFVLCGNTITGTATIYINVSTAAH